MLEVVLGALLGGVITLLVQFVQRRWSNEDRQSALTQESILRKDAEDRQARRDIRAKRVEPLNEYLRLANRLIGQWSINYLDRMLDEQEEAFVAKAVADGSDAITARSNFLKMRQEERSRTSYQEYEKDLIKSLPDAMRGAPNAEIRTALLEVLGEALNYAGVEEPTLVPTEKAERLSKLLEDYIVSG